MAKPEDRSVFDLTAPQPDLTLEFGEDKDQVIDIYGQINSDNKIIVLLHGGYWRPKFDRSYMQPLASALANEGFKVALIEYRRIPGDPDATVGDVMSALSYLIEENLECALILVGHSAGGHLALLAAAEMNFFHIIAVAPLANLLMGDQLNLDEGATQEFLGGNAAERPDLDPMFLSLNGNSVTVIHGVDDQRVPIEISRSYCNAKPEVALIEFPETGHFELIHPQSQEFLEVLRSVSQ